MVTAKTDTGLEAGRHEYAHRGAATQLFRTRFPEVLLSGPAGTGKSRACLEKLNAMACKYSGMRGLLLRKTLVSLGSTALVTWRQHVIEGQLKAGQVWFYGGSSQEPPQYRYGNGSIIVIGGMDKSTKIMSSEYDVIYVQEAIELTEDDWEKLTTRLRHYVMPYQQILADTNPDKPTHWLKARNDRGILRMLESRHEDNPGIYTTEGELTERGASYMAKLDNLTGVRYNRLRRGQWVASEGIIYEQWDSALHLVDKMPKGWQHWSRIWSVDFGFIHPFVWQCWAIDPDGGMWLYRQYVRTQRTVDDHAKVIIKHTKFPDDARKEGIAGTWRPNERPDRLICDHDAEGRVVLERALHLVSKPAHKSVKEGIGKVQDRLNGTPETGPRIHILRGCLVDRDTELAEAMKPTCLEDEIPGYIWKPDPTGERVKEEPLKVDDDSCDAMRYAVADQDLKARVRGDRSFG